MAGKLPKNILIISNRNFIRIQMVNGTGIFRASVRQIGDEVTAGGRPCSTIRHYSKLGGNYKCHSSQCQIYVWAATLFERKKQNEGNSRKRSQRNRSQALSWTIARRLEVSTIVLIGARWLKRAPRDKVTLKIERNKHDRKRTVRQAKNCLISR